MHLHACTLSANGLEQFATILGSCIIRPQHNDAAEALLMRAANVGLLVLLDQV